MTNRLLIDAINGTLTTRRKSNRSGFSINCPMCVSYGQSRADTKFRCGIKYEYSGAVIINCFNCGFSCGWAVGRMLSGKMKHFMSSIGITDLEIKNINFSAWKLSLKEKRDEPTTKDEEPFKIEFENKELPPDSLPINVWEQYKCSDSNFLDVKEYLEKRSAHLLDRCNIYWTPSTEHGMNRRFILPFTFNNRIVGWSARIIDGVDGSRYFTDAPSHFLFNNESMEKDRKYIFVVEGLMDAIAIDGVATQGARISKEQAHWLKCSEKQVIVIPDMDKDGKKMIDAALSYNFKVSIPNWDDDINDVDDAVKRYGFPFTVKDIIDNATDNKIKIKILKNRIA